MTASLAIGIGCRRGCPAEAITALIGAARERVGDGPVRLFTVAEKADEPGLCAAAAALHLDLVALPRAALLGAMPRVHTPSPAAARALGLDSVSEAAALAGAGAGSRLVLPRIAGGGATCAVAAPAENAP